MNKTLSAIAALLAVLASGAVWANEEPAPCVNLKENIARKIIRNGVPASDFRLDIVAKEDVALREGKVVGTCGFGSHRIVYVRGNNINPQVAQSDDITEPVAVAQDEAPLSQPEVPVIEDETPSIAAQTPAPPVASRPSINDTPTQSVNEAEDTATNSLEQDTPAADDNTAQENDSATGDDADAAKAAQPQITITPSAHQSMTITNEDNSIIIHR